MTVSCLFPNKMAVTMAPFWVSILLSVIGSIAADGEFSILHSPDSLKFSGSSKPQESLLKEIFSAALGFSVEENSEWNGLYVSDPFKTPEAVVEVYVDGVSSLGYIDNPKIKTYQLIVDEYEPDTFRAMKHRIEQRFTTGGNRIVNISLSDVNELISNFDDIKVPKVTKQSLAHLKFNIEEDFQFLNELEILKALTTKVLTIKPDNVVDYYNFRFRSLHALSDYHGPKSLQTKEAKKLLGEALQELSNAFVKAYEGSVLVTVVVNDVVHTRRVRAATDTTAAADADLYEDDNYDADYPAIFNILLWFGIVFTLTLVAITYAIMDMDPGRDSIIYRMTSTRMKKDN